MRSSFADLVEEDRAVVGFFKQAFRLFECASEGSRLVAEHLAFQQVAAERGAVDGDKGFAAARTVPVDGLGEHFLAGSCLAGEQDGDVCGGYLAGERYGFLYGGMIVSNEYCLPTAVTAACCWR